MPGTRQVAGTFGRNALEVLVIGDPPGVDAFRQFVSDRAALDEETVRWGTSCFPEHGATGEELWSLAADRLLALEPSQSAELVLSDPCMTRLRAFADRWCRRPALALIGAGASVVKANGDPSRAPRSAIGDTRAGRLQSEGA